MLKTSLTFQLCSTKSLCLTSAQTRALNELPAVRQDFLDNVLFSDEAHFVVRKVDIFWLLNGTLNIIMADRLISHRCDPEWSRHSPDLTPQILYL